MFYIKDMISEEIQRSMGREFKSEASIKEHQ